MKVYKKILVKLSLIVFIVCSLNIQLLFAEASNLFSMDFNEAEISDVLRILSMESGVNIVAGKNITGRVTVSFNDVTLDSALSAILRTNGYDYLKIDNIIRVINLEKFGMETVSKVFILNHVDAGNIKDTLQNMITKYGSMETLVRETGVGNEKTKGRSNVLIVTDILTNLKRIEKLIEQLDMPVPQVMIEAKIIEVTLDKDKKLGIDWNVQGGVRGSIIPTSFPIPNVRSKVDNKGYVIPKAASDNADFPGNALFPYSVKDDFTFGSLTFSDFTATLRMIQTKTDYTILSSPSIATLDNQEAKMIVGEIIPIPTYTYNDDRAIWEITGYEEEEVGITLTVTPHITPEGYVVMEVIPEVSEVSGWVVGPSGQNEKPIISARKAETQLKVKNGETIIIGGLVKNKKTKTITKVPILGNIPLLGLLFRHKQDTVTTTDLLVFITPYIITDKGRLNNGQKYGNIDKFKYADIPDISKSMKSFKEDQDKVMVVENKKSEKKEQAKESVVKNKQVDKEEQNNLSVAQNKKLENNKSKKKSRSRLRKKRSRRR
jgi:type IV pilus secretin PilQ/predicted competence protein